MPKRTVEGVLARYFYDALRPEGAIGNQSSTNLSAKKYGISYFYNGNQLLCEKNEYTTQKVFINDNEGLLGMVRHVYNETNDFLNYESLYYLFNEQGSVTTITNESGKPIKHYQYDPYGNVTNTKTDPINNFVFIGRYGGYRDWDSGLTQFQHRLYEAKTGKWMSRDPIV